VRTVFGEGNLARLRLGTRRSLLAMSQSGWVASEIARLNPGVTVELVGIDTRGDKVLDVPLTQVQGKEFFVAELDHALRQGEVDLSVHSMKDLSLDRPEEFVLGAVPRRENQRDIAIFSHRVFERIQKGLPVRIGTSSPRRQENLPRFFVDALPHLNGKPQVLIQELRGNVNTRLGRLHEPEGSDRALDGVVLAFAGLIRLWMNETAQEELSRLLMGTRTMVLPLTHSPAAAAQGVLAVECRKSDIRVREFLRPLHSAAAEAEARLEREVLRKWGGGCHQRFGASALTHPELGSLLLMRGKASGGHVLDEVVWSAPELDRSQVRGAFNGIQFKGERQSLSSNRPVIKDDSGIAVFVAHSAAVQNEDLDSLKSARIWTSGASSWFKLAAKGLWVEGCAEGLGAEWLKAIIAEPVLRLPAWGAQWSVFTHQDARETWDSCRVFATYQIDWPENVIDSARKSLSQASHCYWSSPTQWSALHELASSTAVHSCGPGKTAVFLRSLGVRPSVFPSPAHWEKWLGVES